MLGLVAVSVFVLVCVCCSWLCVVLRCAGVVLSLFVFVVRVCVARVSVFVLCLAVCLLCLFDVFVAWLDLLWCVYLFL